MNLNQVTIHTSKPLETVEFFRKLGLRLIVDSLPRYVRLECPGGDATLSVSEAETRPVGNVPSSTITLYFEYEREELDAEVARLKDLGIEFTEELADKPWLWREARLKDPNGNNICLFHAAQNRKNPPWRVN